LTVWIRRGGTDGTEKGYRNDREKEKRKVCDEKYGQRSVEEGEYQVGKKFKKTFVKRRM
jgi:hypothetical protein